MGQGHGPPPVPGNAGDGGAQAISRRIHCACCKRLSAAGRWQGAVPFPADIHRGGEMRAALALLLAIVVGADPANAADAVFTQFITSLWPEAQAAGVSRAAFDRET